MHRSIAFIGALLALLVLPAAPLAADAEGELQSQWRGTWVLTRTAMFSECTDHFTDNEVSGNRAAASALRFAAGEPAQVSGLDWTITGLKVRIELAEPYRVAWSDGPYTLHEQRRCRVELRFPRSARPNAAAASQAIAAVLEPVASLDQARTQASWNRRQVEAMPENWEQTRHDYDAWKASQANAAVAARIDELLEDADRIVERSEDQPAYAAAFVRGMRERRYESFSSCASALDATFYVRGKAEDSRDGWEDGQRLAWNINLAAELRKCFVAVPAP
jgi:hypothetical protein